MLLCVWVMCVSVVVCMVFVDLLFCVFDMGSI